MKKLISLLVAFGIMMTGTTVFAQETSQDSEQITNPTSSELVVAEVDSDEPENLSVEIDYAKASEISKANPLADNSSSTITIDKFTEKSANRSRGIDPRGVGNNNPNDAWFIDPSIYNKYIGDTIAGAGLSSWYYVVQNDPAKLTVYMEQASNMDCDVYLYELKSDFSTLHLIAASIYGGGTPENCAAITKGAESTGYYFIEVRPYGTTNGNQYAFSINTSTKYDEYEDDDNITTTTLPVHTSTINVYPTIDNPLDFDMRKFTPSVSGTYYINLNQVSDGASYAFFLYDANLNVLGSFASTSGESRKIALTAGQTYYTQVYSYNGGYNSTSKYNLYVVKPPSTIVTADSNGVYVNGAKIDLTYKYEFFSNAQSYEPSNTWFHRSDELYATSGGDNDFIIREAYRGTYRCDHHNINNAIIVKVENATFYSYLHKNHTTQPTREPERNIFAKAPGVRDTFTVIYDLDLKRTIDVNEVGYTYQFYGDTGESAGTQIF